MTSEELREFQRLWNRVKASAEDGAMCMAENGGGKRAQQLDADIDALDALICQMEANPS